MKVLVPSDLLILSVSRVIGCWLGAESATPSLRLFSSRVLFVSLVVRNDEFIFLANCLDHLIIVPVSLGGLSLPPPPPSPSNPPFNSSSNIMSDLDRYCACPLNAFCTFRH